MNKDIHHFHSRENSLMLKEYTIVGVVKNVSGYMGETQLEVHVGISICKEQNFNKKKGIELATERANTDPVAILTGSEGNTLKPFLVFANAFIPVQALREQIVIDVKAR